MSKTSARANCKTESALRVRWRLAPNASRKPPSLSDSLGQAFVAAKTGTSPKSMPVTIATSAVKSSTR